MNLPGINLLIPVYLDALDYYLRIDYQIYLNESLPFVKQSSLSRERFTRIRCKSIHILLAILSLPFAYEHLKQYLFEDYLEKSHDVQITNEKTIAEYRPKILSMLILALQTEYDVTNAQLLFGLKKISCFQKENLCLFD